MKRKRSPSDSSECENLEKPSVASVLKKKYPSVKNEYKKFVESAMKMAPEATLKTDHKIVALLKEVKLSTKRREEIDEFLKKLKEELMSASEGMQINKDKRLQKMIPSFSCKQKFIFLRPVEILEIGSYQLQTCIKMTLNVDIAIVIPKNCLASKDYLDQSYFFKRALYLAHVARLISSSSSSSGGDLIEEVCFDYERGVHVKPRLIIKPSATYGGQHFSVNVYVNLEKETFKMNRFHVKKNNIRPSFYYQTKKAEVKDKDNYPATPHYNSWFLADLTAQRHQKVLEEALNKNEAIKDAVVLLKVWLHQRQLDIGFGAFSGFLMTSFVVYLLMKGKLSKTVFSFQVFQNTLLELSQSDWSTSGISMASELEDEHRPELNDFHSKFDVVFVDSNGYLNLCSDMNKSTYRWVKHEAQLAVQYMNSSDGIDIFNVLWMTPIPFIRKFDETFRINFEGHMRKCKLTGRTKDDVMDFCGNYVAAYLPRVIDLVDKALGQRIVLLGIRPTAVTTWSINESPPLLDSTVVFGLLLEKLHAYSQVDRGPSGNSAEAPEFRRFWGEKSELRRFQDGTTCEAVVWPSDTIADKRTISRRIIRHVLLRHTAVAAEDATFYVNCFDGCLYLPPQLRQKNHGTGEEEHLAIISTFDSLSKEMRSLDDLPLSITSVQGISPAFCYSEVFPPLSSAVEWNVGVSGNRMVPLINEPCPPYTPSMTVLCMLERSGKWPANKDVCEALKLSFLAQLKISLQTKFGLSSFFRDSLYVYKNGYVFHVVIGFTHEITLSRMVTLPNGLTQQIDTKESLALEKERLALPRLISMLHGLQQQHSTFSCTCRLSKRWLSSQVLLDDYYIDEMAVQVVVASLYISPAPFLPPSSAVVGFVRFLHLMSTHDWNSTPLIVNFNQELNEKECSEISVKFKKERSTLPAMFLSTPVDRFSQMWSKKKPTVHVLTRLARLALDSLKYINENMDCLNGKFNPKVIFRPTMEVYDVVINLNVVGISSRSHLALDLHPSTVIPKYSTKEGKDLIPVYDFDPVLDYLWKLRREFDEFALFFYDVFGGKSIGVVWKPLAFQPLPTTTTSRLAYRKLRLNDDNDEPEVVPDAECIVKIFTDVSSRCVESIDVRRLSPPSS